MIIKRTYRLSYPAWTFWKSVFVCCYYSPRSDEKRLTSRDLVAYSSFARSSQLLNIRLACNSVMRTKRIHIKNLWQWKSRGFPRVDFRLTTQSFQSLWNHTHKLAYYRCSQYVVSYSWIQPLRSFILLDIWLLYGRGLALAGWDSCGRNKPRSVLVHVLEMFMACLLNWNRRSKFEKQKG